jgi:hypothetical protein
MIGAEKMGLFTELKQLMGKLLDIYLIEGKGGSPDDSVERKALTENIKKLLIETWNACGLDGEETFVKLQLEGAVPRRSVVLGEKLKVTQEWRPKTPLGLPMKLATQGTRLREIVGKAEEEGRSKSDVFEDQGKPLEEITDSRGEEAIKISRNFMEYYQDVQGKIKSIGEIDRALNAPENRRLEKFKREAGQVKQLLIEVGAYDEEKFEEAVAPLDATPLSSAGRVDG